MAALSRYVLVPRHEEKLSQEKVNWIIMLHPNLLFCLIRVCQKTKEKATTLEKEYEQSFQ